MYTQKQRFSDKLDEGYPVCCLTDVANYKQEVHKWKTCFVHT